MTHQPRRPFLRTLAVTISAAIDVMTIHSIVLLGKRLQQHIAEKVANLAKRVAGWLLALILHNIYNLIIYFLN